MIDIAIVGAGAAGIGAARVLHATGRRCILLEASSRIGGRAYTAQIANDAVDLGCGWLHSAVRNPWVYVAEQAGFVVDRTPAAWGQQWRDLGFPPDRRRAARAGFERLTERLHADPPPSDCVADAILPGDRWRPFYDALSGFTNGAELAQLSAKDFLAYDDAAGDEDWRLPAGYGSLVAASLPPIELRLATAVTRIDASGRNLTLETPRGSLEARAAIVTVSTAVLAAGGLVLTGGDFVDKEQAAADLPLGLADKLFLAVDGAEELDTDTHLLGYPERAETGSYYLRPFGRPMIEAFFGGPGARALERLGIDGMAAFAIDELASLLGSSWRKRLKAIAATRWQAEGFIGGSYSHARPGCAGARTVLAAPAADGRLLFAGEATSPHDFSTAHGALASGERAAREALTLFAD